MAKKASKKSTSTLDSKRFEAKKSTITSMFAPWVQQKKSELPPIEEPQRFNVVVDVYTRWRGHSFYVMSHYKMPERPDSTAQGFDLGVARLTYKSANSYDVAYFRHTGQWYTFLFDLTLEQAFHEISTNPIFSL